MFTERPLLLKGAVAVRRWGSYYCCWESFRQAAAVPLPLTREAEFLRRAKSGIPLIGRFWMGFFRQAGPPVFLTGGFDEFVHAGGL